MTDSTSLLSDVNLLSNGDFEDNSLSNGGRVYGTDEDDVFGWSFTGTSADLFEEARSSHGNEAGDAFVELDGGSSLSQTVSLLEGGTFQLSFDLFPDQHISASDNRVEVRINGELVAVVDATGPQTLSLDLAAGANEITFVSLSGDHARGPGIDDISLNAVLEAPGAPSFGPNLIANGGFEDNALYDDGVIYGVDDSEVAGWRFSGYTADLFEKAKSSHGNDRGDAFIELDGGSSIKQKVAISEDGSFKLSFDLFPHSGLSASNNRVKLLVDGQEVGVFDATGLQEVTLDLEKGDVEIKFVSLSHSSGCGPGIDDISLHQVIDAPPVDPDMTEVKIDFEDFYKGEEVFVLDDCVTVTAKKFNAYGYLSHAEAMIFDSDHPTGGDWDLATDHQGKILIISEDGDNGDPDDNAHGGKLIFDFAAPTFVEGFKVIDTEEGGTAELFDENGARIGVISLPRTSDGDVASVSIDTAGVSRMVVTLYGSGALDDLCYKKADGGAPPVAADDLLITDEDTAISGNLITDDNGNGVDSDPDGDNLTITAISLGALATALTVTSAGGREGQLTVNADGSYDFSPGGGFDDLAVGESDAITFTYSITDGNGGVDEATVTIRVDGINEPPVATDDLLITDELSAISGSIVLDDNGDGVDFDPNGDPITITSISIGQLGVLNEVLSAGGREASLQVNADGTYLFIPDDDFENLAEGESDTISFAYSITDGNGGVDDAIVTIRVDGINEPPVATNDVFATDEDMAVSGNIVLDNNGRGRDFDSNGDPLTVTAISLGAVGQIVTATSAGGREGDLIVNPDGSFTFTPGPDFIELGVGEFDTVVFNYTITDGLGGFDDAVVTIRIDGVNEPPVAMDDAITVNEGDVIGIGPGEVRFNLLDNDDDPNGDALTVLSANGVPAGTPFTLVTTLFDGSDAPIFVDVTVASNGDVFFENDELVDRLDAGDIDSFSFPYVIDDGNGGQATANANVTILGDTPQSVNIVFLADSSGSTLLSSLAGETVIGDPTGVAGAIDADGDGDLDIDLNGDGQFDSEFDAQLLLVSRINDRLAELGLGDDVDVAVYSYDTFLFQGPSDLPVRLSDGGVSTFAPGDDLTGAFGGAGGGGVAAYNLALLGARDFFETNSSGPSDVNQVFLLTDGDGLDTSFLGDPSTAQVTVGLRQDFGAQIDVIGLQPSATANNSLQLAERLDDVDPAGNPRGDFTIDVVDGIGQTIDGFVAGLGNDLFV